MDRNQRVYERFVHVYTWYELWPPERLILERFNADWHRMRMLDLGVGTGRTSYTFAAITKEYVGIDYVPAMIDKCVDLCGQSNSVRFHVADARDLSRLSDESFDFVLFSWNGIDAVSHEDRKKVLREVRRVLQKHGHFFFSTHSLYEFPFRTELPAINPRELLRSVWYWMAAARRALRLKWTYRRTDVDAVRGRPYAILTSPDHDFGLEVYYVTPEYQLQQLDDAGFETVSVYDQLGRALDAKNTQYPGNLYFLCKPIE